MDVPSPVGEARLTRRRRRSPRAVGGQAGRCLLAELAGTAPGLTWVTKAPLGAGVKGLAPDPSQARLPQPLHIAPTPTPCSSDWAPSGSSHL